MSVFVGLVGPGGSNSTCKSNHALPASSAWLELRRQYELVWSLQENADVPQYADTDLVSPIKVRLGVYSVQPITRLFNEIDFFFCFLICQKQHA